MDLDGENYLRFILALLLVLGLLALAVFLLRRSGLAPKMGRARRLLTIEALPLGPRHRLVLVRRDDVEHLLLLGPQGDRVVETGIVGPGAQITAISNTRHGSSRSFDEMLDTPDEPGAQAAESRMTSSNEPH